MNNRIVLFACLIAVVIASCESESKSPRQIEFEKMKWMEGRWTMLKDDKSMTEVWTMKNDTTLSGQNYFMILTDTFQAEVLSIRVIDSVIYYVAEVLDQNEGRAVHFMMTKNEPGLHLFVNPNHDFPNNILYENRGDSVMYARVSGHINGNYREQEYMMRKNE